jgi:NAD(P)H-dependent nitrite reductase small subunit
MVQKNSDVEEAFAAELEQTSWIDVGHVNDFPIDGGANVQRGKVQIAVFNFASRGEWYATQNMCPHRKAFVLSRGMIGDTNGTPKVACPMHKKTFSLATGESLQGEEYSIRTFPVRTENDRVLVELPTTTVLDQLLSTELGCRLASSCETRVLQEAVPNETSLLVARK